MTFWVLGGSLYLLIRLLRLVSHIYTKYAQINLFKVVPFYGFARLGAFIAGLQIVAVYTISATAPTYLTANLATLSTGLIFLGLALCCFIWPLWGIHRLLVAEKHRQIGQNAERIETTLKELHRHIESSDFTGMDKIQQALASLEMERKILQGVSTWPWSPETLRGVLVTLLLPVTAWVIQKLLERFLTP
jgi:hypothetical protein